MPQYFQQLFSNRILRYFVVEARLEDYKIGVTFQYMMTDLIYPYKFDVIRKEIKYYVADTSIFESESAFELQKIHSEKAADELMHSVLKDITELYYLKKSFWSRLKFLLSPHK